MNEDQKQPVADTTQTQTNDSLEQTKAPSKTEQQKAVNSESGVKTPAPVTPQAVQVTEPAKTQAVQSTATVKASDTVKPQPTGNTVSTVPTTAKTAEPVKLPTAQPIVQVRAQEPVKEPEPVKPQITHPTEVPKLSDVIPTSKVWISGLIGNRQIDCLGPIEIPLKIDEPTYPFTPIPSNPDYTNQVFDYDTSTWVPTDAKSQGQQLTDLTKVVTDLQQASIKYDNTADHAQQMSVQQMQTLMTINAKLDALTKKEGIK